MRKWLFERLLLLAAAGLGPLALPAAAAGGDAKLGADVFAAECAECHSVRAGRNKKGPHLAAVWGRKAGAVSDSKYSDAMLQSAWVWDEDTLRRYITLPKRALPGGTMKYEGLSDPKAMSDLLAYLATLR